MKKSASERKVRIEEVPLQRIAPHGDLRTRFIEVQHPWINRGVDRWISLLEPTSHWPVRVTGAFDSEGLLLATLVRVFSPFTLDRFDRLFERGAHRSPHEPCRPTWHFIAVTRHEDGRGLGLGRKLVKATLDLVSQQTPDAYVCTLSPAVGIKKLTTQLQPDDGWTRDTALRTIREASHTDGKPLLPVLRLHLAAGAALDAVLWQSRQDDVDSGNITLRFTYALEQEARSEAMARYMAWVAERARTISEGRAQPIGAAAINWWISPDTRDLLDDTHIP